LNYDCFGMVNRDLIGSVKVEEISF
jgi:hypothetical protein